MCGVLPLLAPCSESMCGAVSPLPLLAPCSENMCGVHPPCIHFFVRCRPPPGLVLCLEHLALSWILSKIENLASSSLQDEVKLNLYPLVWHS